MTMRSGHLASILLAGFMASIAVMGLPGTARGGEAANREVVYVYLGGPTAWQWPLIGKFDAEKQALNVRVLPLTEEEVSRKKVDYSACRLIYLQGVNPRGNKDAFKEFLASAKKARPDVRIVAGVRTVAAIEQNLPDLVKSGAINKDAEVDKYASFEVVSDENMRRLLIYLAVTYLGRSGKVEPPEKYGKRRFYHPDHQGTFETAGDFLQWAQKRAKDANAPRALLETHMGHILWKNGKVIDALLREFDRQGIIAAALDTSEADYTEHILAFKPDLLMGITAKSGKVEFYTKLGVPKLQPTFLTGETIAEWRQSENAERSGGRMGGMMAMRESEGVIEPRVVGGPETNALDMSTPCVPIPERVERFVARAVAYLRLARKENKDKKIVLQYIGPPAKDEALIGTQDTVYADSIIRVLQKMKESGYTVSALPRDQDELVGWIKDHGRQILSESADELDVLVKSGKAALLPVETYQRWFEARVPKEQRAAVIREWGPVPGNFMVWKDAQGRRFIVIPKIDLGNVLLVPAQGPELEEMLGQEVRAALLDRIRKDPYNIVPSHNQLAVNFWIEEGFKADAMVVWEFMLMDYLLPRRSAGLREADWPDILMGRMPNFRPWPICELNWSLPARRKTCAVLVDHLTSPDTAAGLSDELLNLQNDVLKWESLPEGALEEKFRASVAEQVRKTHLDLDLHIDLKTGRALSADEMRKLSGYLNGLFHEKINVSDHVLGQPPREERLVPWIVQCLHGRFLDGLGEVVPVSAEQSRIPGGRKKFLQQKAEEAVGLVLKGKLSPAEAVRAVGGKVTGEELPKKVAEGFETAKRLGDGFAQTHQEIDNLLLALGGRMVPPGPGNLPERNPSVVPTGRNMYIMNPEEIPSKASWEMGRQMVDQLLAEKLKAAGRYPEKIALSLNFRSTMMDYGVLEAEILYLVGARPVWDASNRVLDVEVIPAKELGRPRIDVFVETYDHYADYLESRLRLWDKAIRMISALDEPGNHLFRNCARVRSELQADGLPADRAEKLSRARIFAQAPDMAVSTHGMLFELTGEWDSRRELVDMYIAERDYAYTDGVWGEKMPEAYRRQLQGTEVVLRNITRGGPLTGAWYNGGNLCLVVKELTGKEPDYYLSDLRTPGEERVVLAEDAMRQDIRATIFNRLWIEGMMKEGYAGAQRMSMSTFSALGWETNKAGSVSDDVWQEIVEVYLRDKKNLKIREWFDTKNPHAFQGIAQTLLESARKEYWRPDEATLLEIARAYADNVVKFGHREPGEVNKKLDRFLERTLNAPNPDGPSGKECRALLAQYQKKTASEVKPEAGKESSPDAREAAKPPTQKPPAEAKPPTPVTGKKLEPVKSRKDLVWIAAGVALLVLIAYGFLRRKGSLR